jgi:hypothetical protein
MTLRHTYIKMGFVTKNLEMGDFYNNYDFKERL